MLDELRAGGYLPASFLDWDSHVAAVVFTTGCNFRCPWCHNSALVTGETEAMSVAAICADIKRRAKFLDGVCISGGEPTLWDGLLPFIEEIRKLELPVKLDTNGSNPAIVEKLLTDGVISHIAMDVKAPLDAAAYKKVVGVEVKMDDIRRSIELIKQKAPSYEFRTTFVPALMTAEDLRAIREFLSDDEHWFVQCFKPVGCLDESFLKYKAADPKEVKKLLPGVSVRG